MKKLEDWKQVCIEEEASKYKLLYKLGNKNNSLSALFQILTEVDLFLPASLLP